MSHSGGGGPNFGAGSHYLAGLATAESRADYQGRRSSLIAPRNVTPVNGLTSHSDHLAAGLSLIGLVAEAAWATIVLAQRLPAVVGWPIAIVIFAVLLVSYRLICSARLARLQGVQPDPPPSFRRPRQPLR